MNRVEELIDELANEIGPSKDGICDWCGDDVSKKPNAVIRKVDWCRGDEGQKVNICSVCNSAVERAHVGLPVTNPEHPDFGLPMQRIHTMMLRPTTLMEFEGHEEALAEVMVKRMQKKIKNMKAA